MVSKLGSSVLMIVFAIFLAHYSTLTIAKSIIPLEVINIGDENVCGTSRERFSLVRISNNVGDPPLNLTKGGIELFFANVTPSQSYFQMNSTLSILKFGNLIESVSFNLGNMTQDLEITYNTPFFIPGGAVSGEAQIQFEMYNDEYPDILCFIIDAIIYDPME